GLHRCARRSKAAAQCWRRPTRAHGVYPARFRLVVAIDPCSYGYLDDAALRPAQRCAIEEPHPADRGALATAKAETTRWSCFVLDFEASPLRMCPAAHMNGARSRRRSADWLRSAISRFVSELRRMSHCPDEMGSLGSFSVAARAGVARAA